MGSVSGFCPVGPQHKGELCSVLSCFPEVLSRVQQLHRERHTRRRLPAPKPPMAAPCPAEGYAPAQPRIDRNLYSPRRKKGPSLNIPLKWKIRSSPGLGEIHVANFPILPGSRPDAAPALGGGADQGIGGGVKRTQPPFLCYHL